MHCACICPAVSAWQRICIKTEVIASAGLLRSSLYILVSTQQRWCGCTHQWLCFAAEQQQILYLVACDVQFHVHQCAMLRDAMQSVIL